MNVTLKPFDFAQAAARAGMTPTGQPLGTSAPATTGAASFQHALGQALGAVSLEQTMVAMQKAQIGFQATLQVRNRLVQAYTEIMSMQV